MEKKRLGRGLQALIGEDIEPNGVSEFSKNSKNFIVELDVDSIVPNSYQPRKNFDEAKLKELSDSIVEKGVVQPIVVREVKGKYELIAGERRLRAVKMAGFDKIPAIIKKIESDDEMLELSLIENVQRDDLNSIEEAKAYQLLIDKFGYTQADVAKKLGKDRTTVTNTIRLLKLPQEIQQKVITGELSAGHARTLLSIDNDEEKISLANKIISEQIPVREVENLVKKKQNKSAKQTHQKQNDTKNYLFSSFEEELQRILGTKVRIEQKDGKGKIEIEFYSNEDFERIFNIIKR